MRRKEKKEKQFSLKLLGNNVDGLYKKFEALCHLLLTEKPSVLFLQETKLGRQGRIKTPCSKPYSWYELHRTQSAEKGANGGGLAIGVLDILDPSWLSEGNDDAEALTVEMWVQGFSIRLICGYGPQEYDRKERKEAFWTYLNSEAQKAQQDGAALIIQMDGNLWAGKEIVPNDPKNQNQNGKYFDQFLKKNPHLSVANALDICKGGITQTRHTKNSIEE